MSVRLPFYIALTLLLLSAPAEVRAADADPKAAAGASGGDGAAACQPQLLQAFQLDGLGTDKPVDMTICPTVTADNNCCSVIDEIKAVKSWNNYSKPKLNLFVEDAANTIERMLALHPYVRKLNDIYIRFHSQDIVKKYTSEVNCFDKDTLLSQDNYNELMVEAGSGKEWYDVYVRNAIENIVNGIGANADNLALVTSTDSLVAIITSLQNDPNLQSLIKNIDKDYAYDDSIAQIKTIIETAFITLGDVKDFQQKSSADKTTLVQSRLGVAAVLTNVLSQDYVNKRIRKDIEEITYNNHIKAIKNFILSKSDVLIDVNVEKPKKDLILSRIASALSNSRSLKTELVYFWGVDMLKKSDSRKKKDTVTGLILKIVSRTIDRIKDSEIDVYLLPSIFNSFNKVFAMTFNLEDILATSMNVNYKSYVYKSMMSAAYGNVERSNPAQKPALLNNYKTCIPNESAKSTYDINFLTLPEISDDSIYLPDYVAKSTTLMSTCLANDKLTNTAVIDYPTLYNTAITNLKAIMSSVIFITDNAAGPKICATVYKASLVKQVTFNKAKFKHCRSSLIDLLQVDTDALVKTIKDMKAEMAKIVDIKKTAYCIVCDKSLSKFVNVKDKQITYSEGFCDTMIKQFSTYLNWKNVQLLDYQNKLFQYLQCYLQDGKSNNFPYPFFGQSHVELSNTFKDCNGTGKDKAEKCKAICQKFNLFNYSEFFDGERVFFEQMYNIIINTIRMYGFRFEKTQPVDPNAPPAPAGPQKSSRLLEELIDDSQALINKQHLLQNNESHFNIDGNHEVLSDFYGQTDLPQGRILRSSYGRYGRRYRRLQTNQKKDPNTGFNIDDKTGNLIDPKTNFQYDAKTGIQIDTKTNKPMDAKIALKISIQTGYQIDATTGNQIDPKTGYLIDSKTGILTDPKTKNQYDPKTSFQIDSKTGNLIDPKTNNQYDAKTGIQIDVKTGKPMDPKTALTISLQTGYQIDAKTGNQIDPVTGWPIDPKTNKPVDPKTVQPQVVPSANTKIDPKTGFQIDSQTGNLIDPKTNNQYDAKTGVQIDTKTGKPMDPKTALTISILTGYQIDAKTGNQIDPITGWLIDPKTTWPIDPKTNKPVDPKTVQPQVDPKTGNKIDAKTGFQIDQKTGNLIDPKTGFQIDSKTGNLIDTKTNNQYDAKTGLLIDLKAGGTTSGSGVVLSGAVSGTGTPGQSEAVKQASTVINASASASKDKDAAQQDKDNKSQQVVTQTKQLTDAELKQKAAMDQLQALKNASASQKDIDALAKMIADQDAAIAKQRTDLNKSIADSKTADAAYEKAAIAANKAKEDQDAVLNTMAASKNMTVNDLLLKIPAFFIQKIKIIKQELEGDKIINKDRNNYVTELTNTNINYQVMDPLVPVAIFANQIAAAGLNPLSLMLGANFDIGVTQKFIKTQAVNNTVDEEWNPKAVRVYVVVNPEDISNFNDDINNLKFNEIVAKPAAASGDASSTGGAQGKSGASGSASRRLHKDNGRKSTTRNHRKLRSQVRRSKSHNYNSHNNENRTAHNTSPNTIKSFLMKLLF